MPFVVVTASAKKCWKQDVDVIKMVWTLLWMLQMHRAVGGRVETIGLIWKERQELWKGFKHSYPSAWT